MLDHGKSPSLLRLAIKLIISALTNVLSAMRSMPPNLSIVDTRNFTGIHAISVASLSQITGHSVTMQKEQVTKLFIASIAIRRSRGLMS